MNDVSELDEETFRLVARLTLEDIEQIEAETNSDDDFAVAIRVHKREVERALVGSVPRPAANSATDDAEVASDFEAEGEFEAEEEPDADVEPKRTPSVKCAVCGEQGCEYVFKCPSGHNYCRECMLTMVEHAMKDESLFPPRCCNQEITLRNISRLLTHEQASAFSARQIELSSTNPTYCHDPKCSSFLGRTGFQSRQSVACSKCNKTTCVVCKGAGHEQDCPKDDSSQEVIRLAREKNWRRCNWCGRIVERIDGCIHMTCLCKADFCYVCGTEWGKCECPQRMGMWPNLAPGAEEDVD